MSQILQKRSTATQRIYKSWSQMPYQHYDHTVKEALKTFGELKPHFFHASSSTVK